MTFTRSSRHALYIYHAKGGYCTTHIIWFRNDEMPLPIAMVRWACNPVCRCSSTRDSRCVYFSKNTHLRTMRQMRVETAWLWRIEHGEDATTLRFIIYTVRFSLHEDIPQLCVFFSTRRFIASNAGSAYSIYSRTVSTVYTTVGDVGDVAYGKDPINLGCVSW